MFPNLQKIVQFILILPFSNSQAERIFSNLKNCKTELRNKLSTDTIVAIFFTKEGILRSRGDKFEPNHQMLKTMFMFQ